MLFNENFRLMRFSSLFLLFFIEDCLRTDYYGKTRLAKNSSTAIQLLEFSSKFLSKIKPHTP